MAKGKGTFESFRPTLSGGVSWGNKTDAQREASFKNARKAALKSLDGQSNREFAETNKKFKDACVLGDVEPTLRQARKFRSKRGKAYAASLEN